MITNALSIAYDYVQYLDDIEIDRTTEIINLVEIPVEKISAIRASDLPALIMKHENRYWFCKVPWDFDIFSSNIGGRHVCADCDRVSAASDEDGGCAKVRDRIRKEIECYEFITDGIQTLNVKHPTFRVLCCSNWTAYPKRKSWSYDQLRKARITLAQNVWPDVTTLEEVRRRKEQNKIKNKKAEKNKK